jgi:Tol biopolymer transport system component
MRRRHVTLLAAGALAAGAGLAIGAPGDISLVSVSSGGAQGATPAEASAVSADGRFVAFTSASALTATPTGGVVQLYVRDRVANTTLIASANAAGQAANAAVDAEDVGNVQFSISGNGRYVVFASLAANLTPADTDAGKDVYRKDLQTGEVALVSVNSAGQKANAAVFGDPDISYDGRRISFGSGAATNLFPADGNNASDVVVRDIGAGTTVLAAQSAAGVLANGTTERSAISADGQVVAFEAPTGTFNLLPGDADARGNDVVVRNLAAGATAGASDPTKATGSGFPDISGDGRYVVFETGEKYADAGVDVSAGNDVYRRDMTTPGAIVLASARDGLDTGGGTDGIRPAISADGGRVAFTSTSTDLVGADGNAAVRDVYARDVAARATRRASARADGGQSSNDSDRGAVAGNGAVVSLVNSDAGTMITLAPGDINSQPDVFAKELAPTDTAPPAIAIARATGTATDPSGIGEVTVNGAAVAVGAGGTFPVPATPGTQTVRAVDGAGNAGTAARTVPAAGVAATALRPRIQRLRASLKGRKLTVRFRLTANARVTVTLLRRTVRKRPRRRIVLTRVGTPLARSLQAGQRTVVLTLKRRPPAGRYVVRVRARAGALVATTTTALRVAAPRRR